MNVYKIKNSKLDDKTVIAEDMPTAITMYCEFLETLNITGSEIDDITASILSCEFVKHYDNDIIMEC